jgi:hypothetical protein
MNYTVFAPDTIHMRLQPSSPGIAPNRHTCQLWGTCTPAASVKWWISARRARFHLVPGCHLRLRCRPGEAPVLEVNRRVSSRSPTTPVRVSSPLYAVIPRHEGSRRFPISPSACPHSTAPPRVSFRPEWRNLSLACRRGTMPASELRGDSESWRSVTLRSLHSGRDGTRIGRQDCGLLLW